MTGKSNVSELVCQRVDCKRVDVSASWFVSELSCQRVDCQRVGLSARCLWSNAITDTKKGRTGIAPTYLHTTLEWLSNSGMLHSEWLSDQNVLLPTNQPTNLLFASKQAPLLTIVITQWRLQAARVGGSKVGQRFLHGPQGIWKTGVPPWGPGAEPRSGVWETKPPRSQSILPKYI